ncbi:Peptidase M20A, peptidase V [Shewanella piezotolerans WP3]|uniref:Peptidase M20A, peptidase V n=1 Tax=Shewanella piezotolerans (strain WP3 / JCM 13877) TaxID=225849 RepID=B8CNR0_SHEPW|nr:dipeptidase [Shewanella piezotolerans]ACJ29029.1 Peptidase M20A, peptidase V [Shewanella piezotolerans WP3]
MKRLTLLFIGLFSLPCIAIGTQSDEVAHYAVEHYADEMVASLATLVQFNTVAVDGQTPDSNPEFIGFKRELRSLSDKLGLDYVDHGYVILIGLGQQDDKVGVITHGDVQPANPALWQQSPYQLDMTSQPGKLIGRGTEDDKGPIVTAMYAMKSIKDSQIKLNKRIELMVYMAEESNWEPLKAFLKTYTPANINITIDAEYPVVTAEKGWSKIEFVIPSVDVEAANKGAATLKRFSGGYFGSQVPQQAQAEISFADKGLIQQLKVASKTQSGMTYRFEQNGSTVVIYADGKAAHSSTPEDGVNAVTHLAQLLAIHQWPKNTASLTQQFIHEMIGMGIYAEKFGDIAYKDDFMGPMSLAPTIVKAGKQGTQVMINLRRPIGKTPERLDSQTYEALERWQEKHQVRLAKIETYWGKPMVMQDAPHLNTLLDVYSHFTGVKNPQPVAIGGSTNSKLFPNALSFGPAMPGVEYTGHTENEFITYEQFMLNLKMYSAAFIELAK